MVVMAALAASACSSASAPSDAGPPPCITSECYAGDKCLDDGTGNVQCRLPCASQSDCPPNYTCTEVSTGDVFCAPDAHTYSSGKGEWGASCNPTGGVDDNPDCDWSQAFRCYATSPTDADAFCTQFFCTSNADCRGGYWCATVNLAPNAENAARSDGQTYTVCKPREYCAPCRYDVDCFNSDGVKEYCIEDVHGGRYCAPECTEDSNCDNEAQCITLNQKAFCSTGAGTCVCAAIPRECIGDGKLCSPCLSDADCKNGLCVQADYSTEHFCTVKSGVACTVDMTTGVLTDQCPSSDEANVPVGCTTTADENDIPVNQCIGIVTFGTDSETGEPVTVAGCYTPDR